MKSIAPAFLLILMFLAPSIRAQTTAATTCVNGAPEKNDAVLKSFNENQDTLKKAFLKSKSPLQPSKAPSCSSRRPAEKHTSDIKNVAMACEAQINASQGASGLKLIKKECMLASVQIAPGGNKYLCDKNNRAKNLGPARTNLVKTTFVDERNHKRIIKVPHENVQCFNQEMLDYLHFAVNEAIKCLSPDKNPVDSRYLLKKFNVESAFNFSISGANGRGLGQITTSAAKEMTDPKRGNGKKVFREVAQSENPACAPFKAIADHDLKNPVPVSDSNVCDWTSPGDGVARNLLYSIAHHIHMRDEYVKPALEKLAPRFANNSDIVNNLTTMSYGREGIVGVRATIGMGRLAAEVPSPKNAKGATAAKTPSSEAKFLNKVKQTSNYVSENDDKLIDLLCFKKSIGSGKDEECDDHDFKPAELAGNTCVDKP